MTLGLRSPDKAGFVPGMLLVESGQAMLVRENRRDYSYGKPVRVKCRQLSNPKRCLTCYLDSFQQAAKQAYENIGGDARLQ